MIHLFATCQIGSHFAEIGKCQGLTKGSRDSAAVVKAAVWQNDHQPYDVCHVVVHFTS